MQMPRWGSTPTDGYDTTDYKAPVTLSGTTTASASTSVFKEPKSSTLFYRVSLIVTTLGLYAVFVNMFTTPSTDVDLSQYTDSIFIPFIYKFSTKHDPQVLCTVDGVNIKMPVDTGSTGLLIGAPILPNVSPIIGTPAHHFFTSSRILYVGRLVSLSIGFHGEAGSYATATVPIFIVDKSWRCPWYNPSKDRFDCPLGPNGEKAIERDTSRITYMGVGFGRNGARDGMPFAAPKVNAFLNIDMIDGSPVSKTSMRAGYVMSKEGVHLGLTPKNMQGFTLTGLEPGLTHAEDPRDWAMARMCFSINDDGINCGPALIDSGIPQMYIRTGGAASIPTVVIRNPNKNGHAKFVKRVKPGTKITVGFPTLDAPVSYSFIVGENSSIEPSYVVPGNASPPFVNTGRNFLFGYSIMFDAIGGRFGFHPANSLSSSALL
ncbi:hypothetical protein BKA66DRAFT_35864 [Pyrenochaeta sp. MPI-SDFR-AT-0127]|nr:hypothetical protein BKA66DRAFT_35864 [Pyrenochaeta sp. MPI-SDFR-AT-0127]